jgi:alkylation response protein AidB-like acyl-CoA dehydrogenase
LDRLSQEQREFRDLARKCAQEEIKPRAMALDREPEWEKRIPWDLLKKGSQLGFRTFVLQEENGGSGMSDHLTSCLVAEELAAGELGTAYYFMPRNTFATRTCRSTFRFRSHRDSKSPKRWWVSGGKCRRFTAVTSGVQCQ